MSTILSFKSIQNKHAVYRGNDIWKFCEYFREFAIKIINFKKKKNEAINKAAGIIWKYKILHLQRKTCKKYLKDKKYRKVRDHCHYTEQYRGAAHNKCNLKYSVPKEISIVFHNGSKYDYRFIIKELAEEFENLKTIYLLRRKPWKMHNLFCSNTKRNYKNW